MARRRGLMASLAQIQRDAARAEAARRRAHAASQRAAVQARVRYERAAAADERERKRLYAESRAAEVAAMNAELADTLAALDGVLAATLDVDNYFDLDQLKNPTDLGQLAIPEPPPPEASFLPAPLSGLSRMLGSGAHHEEQLRAGRARYQQACAEHAAREGARRTALAQAEADNRQRAQDVEALRRDLAAAVPQAVVTYIDLVLNASPYPDGSPAHWRLAFVPESRQLVIEYDLETAPTAPTTPYGTGKLAADNAAMDLAGTGAIGAVSLRAFNISGALPGHPDPDETRLIPRMMAVQRGIAPELVVNGDGDAIRDFVYVSDMAEAFALALETCEPGTARVYNIGSGRPTRVRDVIRMVEQVTGRPVAQRHVSPAAEPQELLADSKAIQADLGWHPRRSDLRAIIEDAWAAATRQ